MHVITSADMDRMDRTSVAIPREVAKRAKALSALASKYGWSALGIDRDDPPTLTAIFEEAINVLAARAKPPRSKR
jgi:hypothetical protein